jgi:Ala-tRNA(Pro) deacylase
VYRASTASSQGSFKPTEKLSLLITACHCRKGRSVPMSVKKLKGFLNDQKVKYVTISHSLAYTAQEIAASAHIHGKDLAKTVIVKIDGDMAMAVLPASFKLDLGRLKQIVGAKKVGLAAEKEFQDRFPGCALGAMPPFGNLYDMRVYADKSLSEDEKIAFNAGSHTELIQLAYKDFEGLVKPKIVTMASPEK